MSCYLGFVSCTQIWMHLSIRMVINTSIDFFIILLMKKSIHKNSYEVKNDGNIVICVSTIYE